MHFANACTWEMQVWSLVDSRLLFCGAKCVPACLASGKFHRSVIQAKNRRILSFSPDKTLHLCPLPTQSIQPGGCSALCCLPCFASAWADVFSVAACGVFVRELLMLSLACSMKVKLFMLQTLSQEACITTDASETPRTHCRLSGCDPALLTGCFLSGCRVTAAPSCFQLSAACLRDYALIGSLLISVSLSLWPVPPSLSACSGICFSRALHATGTPLR